MKTYMVHDRDGYAVGMVTSATEGAPPVSAAGHGDLLVTEVDVEEGVVRMTGPEAEKQAADVLRSLRVERRLARR
jgi:hypothetical protein